MSELRVLLLRHLKYVMSRRSTPLDQESCRQCSSFSDYVKVAKRKTQTKADEYDTGSISSSNSVRTDCPLDKDELGNRSWGLLHTIAAKYSDEPTRAEQKDIINFFNIFSRLYPCDHCAQDFRKELQTDPPKVKNQEELSQWLCRLHNRVNVKIGKKEFDCSKVNERWRDGWLDGSCD